MKMYAIHCSLWSYIKRDFSLGNKMSYLLNENTFQYTL